MKARALFRRPKVCILQGLAGAGCAGGGLDERQRLARQNLKSGAKGRGDGRKQAME